MTAIFHKPIK